MRNLLLAGVIALSLAGYTLTLAEPPPPEGEELQGYIDEQARRVPVTGEIVEGVVEVSLTSAGCLERAQQFLAQIDVTTITDEQLEQLYEYYLHYLVPCLGSYGAVVTQVPSRAAFADGGGGQPGWWNPFLAVEPPASTADVDLLFAKCAPYPDAVRL